jgi:thioredoxin-dependent peroxiredoxin
MSRTEQTSKQAEEGIAPQTEGQTVVDFSFTATSGLTGSLSDYQGKKVVLYFYPRDNTPGCTMESKDFRDLHDAFTAKNTVVLGISRDTLKKHENFKAKYDFPFELIADPEEVICNQFDVIKHKSMFGKKVRGIQRSTFVFDESGALTHEWRKVKVIGHAKEVLAVL